MALELVRAACFVVSGRYLGHYDGKRVMLLHVRMYLCH